MSVAADLQRKGYSVVLLNADKKPIQGNWQTRTVSREEAEAHDGPAGIRLGGLTVIDIDHKQGRKPGRASLEELKREFPGMLGEPMQETKSGGYHYLYAVDDMEAATLPNKADVLPGIDVLRGERYIAVYQPDKIPHRDTLARMPDDLLTYFQNLGGRRATSQKSEPERAPIFELLQKAVGLLPNSDEYNSRDEWLRIIMAIKGACEGTDFEEQGEELAQEWSAKWPGGNDPAYVAKTYQENRPKAGWHTLAAEVEKHTGVSLRLEEAQAVLAAAPLPVEAKPPFVWLRDYLRNPDILKPPVARIPRLAWPGRTTLLAGLAKSGKSTLLSDGVARLTRGEVFLGEPCTPCTALWYCLDEPAEDLARRLAEYGADPDRIAIVSTRPRSAGDIEALVRQIGAAVVILDSLARYAIGIVTKPGDAHQWTELLRPLVDVARSTGCSMVWVHHNKKASGEVRDSTAIEAEADVILTFQPHARGETRREVYAKGRVVLQDFRLDFREGRYVLVAEGVQGAELAGGDRTWQVLWVLRQAAEPMTTGEWLRTAKESAVGSRTAFYRARASLVESHYVSQNQKSRRWLVTPAGEAAIDSWRRDSVRVLDDSKESAGGAVPTVSTVPNSPFGTFGTPVTKSPTSPSTQDVCGTGTGTGTSETKQPPAINREAGLRPATQLSTELDSGTAPDPDGGEVVEAVPCSPKDLEGLQAVENGRVLRFANSSSLPLPPEEAARYRQAEDRKRQRRERQQARALGL